MRALARSERAAERVRELGAEAVSGDLDDLRIEGCEVAFHAAAKVEDWGDPADFERVNVRGTQNVVDACRAGGVRRLVHVGTEAALMAGQPLVNVDENAPLRPDSPALYSVDEGKSGTDCEDGGSRDRGRAPALRLGPRRHHPAAGRSSRWSRSGRFRWVGGGRQLTATTHIDNTVEGLWLGATKAPAGRRLLRDRRRAGRVPRVPDADCSAPRA